MILRRFGNLMEDDIDITKIHLELQRYASDLYFLHASLQSSMQVPNSIDPEVSWLRF